MVLNKTDSSPLMKLSNLSCSLLTSSSKACYRLWQQAYWSWDDMQLKHDHQLHQAQQMSTDLVSKLLALFRYQTCEQPLLINTFTHCFIALEKWSTNYCYKKTHLLTERRKPLLLNTCLVKHQPLATLKSSPPL